MESSRVRQAKVELGIDDNKQKATINKSVVHEYNRQQDKLQQMLKIQESKSYRLLKTISSVMDKYFLDPILGVVPTVGDAVSSVVSLPFIYVSLFKVGSLPLTLAVIYNILRDTLIGMIPFWIGNILDVFNRSYLRNMRLIVGFVEDDKEIIKEVNQKAVRSLIGIIVFCLLIYAMIKLIAFIITWISNLFS
ncbi:MULTISPECIES: DUF4112 domain-containing protein [Myroides]|uniref:DUF4112 domain-containing protein n=1 Tax=Myroides albus TaxID=2562892 RepID=A0A6I3LLU9_9FLAO|nr:MULTISPECIES: DUF4112 domain-containing protein [Myroides]MTG98270.1 DUF4112 domain-containing protein [Myroides albus]MVX35396.1 DUF4112 domain-containing protein [Myroides sp. LoEW2-1]UVD79004.1 DUF4112 domain-containing protein [Myroides albus]